MMLLGSRISRTGLLLALSASLFFIYFAYSTFLGDVDIPWRQLVPSAGNLDGSLPSKGAALNPPPTSTLSLPLSTIVSNPPYPSDYLPHQKDDDSCVDSYSAKYLDYTAAHHIAYCEDGSRSSMECFRTHGSDPLCVAKGVIIDHKRAPPLKDTAMNCKLRNFTTERLERPWAADELEGVQNIADMRSYFFGTGVMEQLQWFDMDYSASEAESQVLCDAQNNDHRWTLMVKREGNMNIWHKLMELWQSMISLDILQIAIDPSTGKPYLSQEDVHNVQVVVEDDQEQVVDEWWPMLTGNPLIRKSKMEASCLGNVIIPLAGSSSPFWQSHWSDQDCHETFLVDAFLRRLYKHIGITPQKRDKEDAPKVTIIDRTGETRKIFDLAGHLDRARKRWPEVTFEAIDFATLSLKEQVELVHNSDVLIGVTGAAMTHILWLQEESSIAEIMTHDFHYSGFRNLAKMRNLNYFTAHGVDIAAEGQTHEEWEAHAQHHANDLPEGGPLSERGWQSEPWLYLTDEGFQALVDAAINAALNKGLSAGEVKPRKLFGLA